MTEFEVADRPEEYRKVRKWTELKRTLADLPDGKAIRLPKDMFRGHPVSAHVKVHGRRLHQRTLPDGVYVWLEVKP